MSKEDIKKTITDICDNRLKALGEYDFFKDASLEIKFWRVTGLVNNDIEDIIDRCEEERLDTLLSEFTYYIPSGSAFESSDGPGPDPYASKYFTTEMLSSGTIRLQIGENVSTEFLTSISYRINGGEWVETLNVDNQQVIINPSTNTNDIVEWKGTGVSMDNPAGQTTPDPLTYMSYFISDGELPADFNVSGNIMSLLYGDDFESQKTISAPAAFSGLFINNGCLYSAENLILPATTISFGCYFNMFSGCTNLTTAPKTISATTLAPNCCDSMFGDCSSLITAPELPATTLAEWCYYGMFSGCTSLITAPELPATTLAEGCYGSMFSGCTSLTTAPKLPATTLAEYCYSEMFRGCTSLTTGIELPATTLANDCYGSMFYGCIALTTGPELPATELVYECYSSMFYGCTALTTAPELPATTLVDNCYTCMFYNCENLNYIKALFLTEPSESYTDDWVSNVSATGTFVRNENATWNVRGVEGIPEGWDIEPPFSPQD